MSVASSEANGSGDSLPVRTDELLHSRFFRNAIAFPERACLEHRGRIYSYGECMVQAERLADSFAALVTPGQTIAFIAEREPALVWGMLGAARAGAIFTVIDSAYPEGRIAELIDIARPELVVRTGDLAGWPMRGSLQNSPDVAGAVSAVRTHDPAYFLFTSGSTGRPKCVACSHEPLVRFVDWQAGQFDLGPADRFSMLSGLSHDPVLRDIFTPLSIGATIVMPEESDIREPGALRIFLADRRVSIAHLTPPMGRLLVAGRSSENDLPCMRHFFWGGDRLDCDLVNRIARMAPSAEQTNFYGSTETPQAAAYYRIPRPAKSDPIPIGQGAVDHKIEIVPGDEGDKHSGHGGQIAVRSPCLSLGYVEDGCIRKDALTIGGEQLYLTGDTGYRGEDGNHVLVGRIDDQVKIRGYRVDPSEIARQLQDHPLVTAACALPIREGGSAWIACFAASDSPELLDEAGIESHLAQDLPSYMLPRRTFILKAGLPLLPNGKIDRASLVRMATTDLSGAESGGAAPLSHADLALLDPKVRALMEAWSDLLQRDDVGPDSSFNELDGDSLSYVQAYMAVEELVGPVPENWPDLSIRQIAEHAPSLRSPFAKIESVIVIRALSMAALVALHAELSHLGDGVTAALFMVSGYVFGKSEWASMFRPELAVRMLNPIKSLLPLTALFSIASAILATEVLGYPFSWPSALLCADLLDFPPGHQFIRSSAIYWYLHSLLKLLPIAFAVQWLLGRHFRTARSQFAFICAATAVFFAIRFVSPFVMVSGPIEYTPNVLRVFATNPLATIPLFYLGIAMSAEIGMRMRTWLFAAILVLALLNAPIFGILSSAYIAVGAFLILFIRNLPVPRPFAKPVFQIAAASFYIYLVHTWVDKPMQALAPDAIRSSIAFPFLLTGAGIVAGIMLMNVIGRTRQYWNEYLRTGHAGKARRHPG